MSSRLENNKVAARYARALFEGAGAEADAVLADLQQVADAFESVPMLTTFLENPGIPQAEKVAFVEAQFKALNPWVVRLLRLMVENGRTGAIPLLVVHLRQLIHRRDNVSEAEVVTAVDLDDELLRKVRQMLERSLGYARVDVHNRVDPGILGGMIIKVQDRIIDGSYAGRLEELRRQIVKV